MKQMSLVICEECGKEISDKAKACPHCGCPIDVSDKKDELETKTVEEQKEEQDIEDKESNVVSNAESKESVKKSKKKIIIIVAVIAAIAIAGTVFGVIKYNEKKAQEKYDSAVDQMRGSALLMNLEVNNLYSTGDEIKTIEQLINLTNSVWHDAIWEESSKKTKKYVKGAKGFEEALENLYADPDISEYVSKLTEFKDRRKKEKIDCPEELQSVKEKYDDVFAAFSALVDYAEYPSGSYNTYMEDAQDKFDDFNTAYSKFDSACPEMKTDKKDKETDE